MLLHNRATALDMKISEYLNLIIQDYEDQRRQADTAQAESDTLRKENKSLLERARELAANVLTRGRIRQIKEEAVKEYQQMQIINGVKSPYIEVNKELRDRLGKYEKGALKNAFEKVKGKITLLPGHSEKMTFHDLPDLVGVLVELYRAEEKRGGEK